MSAILAGGLVAGFALPATALIADVRRRGWGRIAISPFWYLTLLWLVSFPVRAWLLGFGITTTQSKVDFTADELGWGLMLGLGLWAVMWLGYRRPQAASRAALPPPPAWWPGSVLLTLAAAGLVVLTLGFHGTVMDMPGKAYFASRAGNGWFYLIPELAFPALIGAALAFPHAARPLWVVLVIAVALVLTAWLSQMTLVILGTRRNLATMVFLLVVLFALSRPTRWGFAAIATLATLFGSMILAIARIAIQWANTYEIQQVYHFVVTGLLKRVADQAYIFSSSFEGVDHAARLLALASPAQILTGIDHGVSWAFNAGLSLVPRALWPGKPLATGNLAQQEFLYPHLFHGHISQVAQPPSFAVDYMYGFGLPGALVLAFATGWLLRRLGTLLVAADAPVVARALALFVFVNMFNVVRSGTGFISQIVIFAVLLVIMYGPARCLDGARALLPSRRHERLGAAGEQG